jgi:pantothenate kinase
MNTLSNISKENTSPQNRMFWGDNNFADYYTDYYNKLSSKELDSEFNHVLKVLVAAMDKLNDPDKKASINVLSKVIEHYISLKIDKDLQQSLKRVLTHFNE